MFFAKQGGDFNIKKSQQNQDDSLDQEINSRNDLKTPNSNKSQRKSSQERLYGRNSVLNNAGKNILENQKKQPGNRIDELLSDQGLQQRILKNFAAEGGIADNLFQKPPKIPSSKNPIQPNLSSQLSGRSGGSGSSGMGKRKNSDPDMLSLMAQRLSKAELLAHNQREEIKEKSQKIMKLEQKLEVYQKSDDKNFAVEYEKLQKENDKLKKQIEEMESFLKQYGLKWRGYQDGEEAKNDEEIKELKKQLSMLSDPKFKYNLPSQIDINVIIKRIEDLNYVMQKEGGANQIIKNKQGIHEFKRQDSFPIGFYSNGLVLKGFPFYPYGSNQASQILADILDGYFPYQLKKEYPSGVLLKIIDKTDEKYSAQRKQFQGQVMDINQVGNNDDELKPMSKNEFLNKLPENVVKDGKVIPIRSEIAKKFEYNNEIETLENAKKQENYKQKANQYEHVMEDERTYLPLTEEQKKFQNKQLSEKELEELCLLKIRTESGKNIILLRLFSSKKIQDVYEIVKYFAETKDFSILDNATRQVINRDRQENLEDLDMHPNAVLTLKQQQKEEN